MSHARYFRLVIAVALLTCFALPRLIYALPIAQQEQVPITVRTAGIHSWKAQYDFPLGALPIGPKNWTGSALANAVADGKTGPGPAEVAGIKMRWPGTPGPPTSAIVSKSDSISVIPGGSSAAGFSTLSANWGFTGVINPKLVGKSAGNFSATLAPVRPGSAAFSGRVRDPFTFGQPEGFAPIEGNGKLDLDFVLSLSSGDLPLLKNTQWTISYRAYVADGSFHKLLSDPKLDTCHVESITCIDTYDVSLFPFTDSALLYSVNLGFDGNEVSASVTQGLAFGFSQTFVQQISNSTLKEMIKQGTTGDFTLLTTTLDLSGHQAVGLAYSDDFSARAVPEPAPLALMILGLVGLGCAKRKTTVNSKTGSENIKRKRGQKENGVRAM